MFPIMHLIEIRRGIVEREPWVAASLLRAFAEAKGAAVADLWSPGALKISLPWVSASSPGLETSWAAISGLMGLSRIVPPSRA
jgi:hypothetical protein